VRAVREAVAALRAAGHELIPFAPRRVMDGVELFYSLLSADGAKTVRSLLVGERLEDFVRAIFSNVAVPGPVRSIIAAALRMKGEEAAARVFNALRELSVTELWAKHKARKELRAEWFAAIASAKLDAVLTPAHALPAIRHGQYRDVTFACSYTLMFNLLDFPAGVLPVTIVSKEDAAAPFFEADGKAAAAAADADGPSLRQVPGGVRVGMLDHKVAKKWKANAEASVGLPVGVQVVGLPFREENVLKVMAAIESSRALPRTAFTVALKDYPKELADAQAQAKLSGSK
jgi:fatty acid amide hydrolase